MNWNKNQDSSLVDRQTRDLEVRVQAEYVDVGSVRNFNIKATNPHGNYRDAGEYRFMGIESLFRLRIGIIGEPL